MNLLNSFKKRAGGGAGGGTARTSSPTRSSLRKRPSPSEKGQVVLEEVPGPEDAVGGRPHAYIYQEDTPYLDDAVKALMMMDSEKMRNVLRFEFIGKARD